MQGQFLLFQLLILFFSAVYFYTFTLLPNPNLTAGGKVPIPYFKSCHPTQQNTNRKTNHENKQQ